MPNSYILITHKEQKHISECTLNHAYEIFNKHKDNLSEDIKQITIRKGKNCLHAQRLVSMFLKVLIEEPQKKEMVFNKYMKVIFQTFNHSPFGPPEELELLQFLFSNDIGKDKLKQGFVEFDLDKLKNLSFLKQYTHNLYLFKYEKQLQTANNFHIIEEKKFRENAPETHIIDFILKFTNQYLTHDIDTHYQLIDS